MSDDDWRKPSTERKQVPIRVVHTHEDMTPEEYQAAFAAGRGSKSVAAATHVADLAKQLAVYPAILAGDRLYHLMVGRDHMEPERFEAAIRRVRAPHPPRFRYLDHPITDPDGKVVRWPYVAIQLPTGSFYMRLRKGRARCTTCHHRHGPSRNNAAIQCCSQVAGRTRGPVCGCKQMVDWPPPAVLLGEPKASAGRQMYWGQQTIECAWCGHDIKLNDPALLSDDEGWKARQLEHHRDCEWAVRRGRPT